MKNFLGPLVISHNGGILSRSAADAIINTFLRLPAQYWMTAELHPHSPLAEDATIEMAKLLFKVLSTKLLEWVTRSPTGSVLKLYKPEKVQTSCPGF